MTNKIGIIGIGHFAGYLIEGFHHSDSGTDIVLSPRGKEEAQKWALKYGYSIAKDNQEVIDRSDIIILSVKPDILGEVIKSLNFKEGQLVISVAAGAKYNNLSIQAKPVQVVCAMPLSSAAINQSPTLLYPAHDRATEILELLGPVTVFNDEEKFITATTYSAFYGWNFKFLEELVSWGTDRGLDDDTCRNLVQNMFKATSEMSALQADKPLAEIVETLATKDSITELGLKILNKKSGFDVWHEALDAVHVRLSSNK